MKDIIEEIILTVCIAGIVATCGIHYSRKSDAAVDRYAEQTGMWGQWRAR